MIAVIQIRGEIDAKQTVKDTLKMLNLGRKMSCILVDENDASTMGMVRKCKDFVTYGEVSEDTVKTLQKIMEGKAARLHPPRGGMKSVKRPVNAGGDLGFRANGLDSMIGRMMP